jgi:diphosphomevalonate decarboxylase
LDYINPKLILETSITEPNEVIWQSPSNIALIKYWGKYGNQLPKNPSISFTLDQAVSQTAIAYSPKENNDDYGISLSFKFHGEHQPAFESRMKKFLESLTGIFPFLNQLDLDVRSTNSFPHSAGIASSASSMSALALCLCSMEHELFGTLEDNIQFDQKASFIARLGSGSACRSVYPLLAMWGESSSVPGSSNEYAIGMADHVHDVFTTFHNDILIVSKDEKEVSSTVGHNLMENNLYADNRYLQAKQRLNSLLDILKSGDLEAFGRIVEDEALTLHALMMTSNPSFVLMRPGTLTLIEKIRAYRKDTGHQVYFSLDAGPNIHLMYPSDIAYAVRGWIESDLQQHCEDRFWIADGVGEGPVEM